ncbi:MAG: hypothetical protein V1835_05840 [Candidatus Micrarchaeota archaeon]
MPVINTEKPDFELTCIFLIAAGLLVFGVTGDMVYGLMLSGAGFLLMFFKGEIGPVHKPGGRKKTTSSPEENSPSYSGGFYDDGD